MNIDKDALKKEISNEVTDKIDEIFLKFQEKLDIKHGDISPMDSYELDELMGKLTNNIHRVILFQMDDE